jgi:CRISPR-associated protein Csb1
VVAIGGIRRDSTLQLAALRLLAASTEQETVSLRRYILGLALTALTYPEVGYLRQGCNLVLDSRTPREFVEVYGDGRRVPIAITHHDAKTYAHAVAAEFGVEKGRIVSFSPDLARADLAEADGGGSKPRKTRRGKAG